MFFFSVPTEKKQPKRELAARSGSEQITALRTGLRDSLRSNKSSTRLRRRTQSLICCLPSRYRNHLRSIVLGQRTKVKGSLPFRERLRVGERSSGMGSGVGFKSYAAPLMGRAYHNVRATRRSGCIPLLERRGRGSGRVPSLGKEGLGRL